jgi:hypothetical protein
MSAQVALIMQGCAFSAICKDRRLEKLISGAVTYSAVIFETEILTGYHLCAAVWLRTVKIPPCVSSNHMRFQEYLECISYINISKPIPADERIAVALRQYI